VRDITGQFTIGGDLDAGQTSAVLGGNNSGMGQLTAERIHLLQIGSDFDIGQSTGDGRSSGSGTVSISNVTNFVIRDSLDIAKIRAINNAINSGMDMATIANSTLSVGFAAVNPGSIEISHVMASEIARGNAQGTLILNNVEAQIANDIIVGELALGSTNAATTASATLRITNSLIHTRDLSISLRFNNTAGTLDGTLDLTRSLVTIGSVFSMG
jgi:hypothetical protein